MADVVGEKNDNRPLAAIADTDIAEARHVRPSATEKLEQHVFDVLLELIGLIDDQYGSDVAACGQIEGA